MKIIGLLKICAVILFVLIATAVSDARPPFAQKNASARGVSAEQAAVEAARTGFENKAAEIYARYACRNAPAEPEKSAKRVYSAAEKKLIARVVYAESRGEPFEGQAAVAAVVINRYESGRFGRTLKSVVYAKNQFAVGRSYNKQSMAAVEAAIAENKYPPDMFYFRRSAGRWRDLIFYRRIGRHSFYLSAH